MHQEQELVDDAQQLMSWLDENKIKYLPRQLDGDHGTEGKRIYNQATVKWFNSYYKTKTFASEESIIDDPKDLHLTDVGRACCGGRQTCKDQNYKQRHMYVTNKFPDWYCSVNHFFLYVKQVTGEVFVNKDCKMNFEGSVGPIGNLSNAHEVLSTLEHQLSTKSLPVIQCKKHKCHCGLCAPKAKQLDTYKSIMEKYQLN
jgi:hypothetical protein